MAVYAVTYLYVDDEEQKNEVRPSHREWLAALNQDGIVLASGPFRTSNGALLIFNSASIAELTELLGKDPFATADLIRETNIEEWTNAIGPWTELN